MISNAINSDLMGVCVWFFECFVGVFNVFFDSRNMSLRPAPVPHKFCIEILSQTQIR